MELDQATEQFYEKLSERLREKGFSTRIIEDGCLEVTSEKIRGKQKTHCAVGRDGEVYCHSEDLANITRNRDLNTVLEEGNGAITEYGLIRRTDGQPLPVFTGKPQREEFAGPQMTGM